jgi:AcrR family transcriptional regulator
LDAARAAFAERGYDGASMSDIARRAGVAKSVIYDHFPSKAEMHKAILLSDTLELQAHVAAAVAEKREGTPQDRLEAGVDAYFRFVEEHPAAWSMLVRDPPADPDLLAYHGELERRSRESVAALFVPHEIDDPRLRERKQMLAELLRTAIRGLAHWWYDHPEIPRERLVATVASLDWFRNRRC